ncbi:MAG: hypothetical protein J6W96_06170 [Alphaproteobacteria bacterium]|nr:hypothetical protein [Alphaproteobacteria bacterium]
MSYFSTYDMAHKFFYDDLNGYYTRANCRSWYNAGGYYSYGTRIGQRLKDKNGVEICLISINCFSHTTVKHLSELRSAAPVECLPVYFEYGDNAPTLTELANRAVKNMEFYAGQPLSRAANRDGFLTAYKSYKNLKTRFKISVKIPRRLVTLANTLNDSEAVKKLKARAAAVQREKTLKAREELKKLMEGRRLMDLARAVYSYDNPEGLTSDERANIKKIINPAGAGLSFIWLDDNGDFQTSQHIHMTRVEGLKALKLWAAGKLKHGLTVGFYTVLEVLPDVVKIGCHKIPVENLKELATAAGVINV